MRNISTASLLLTMCTFGVSFGACSSDPATESTTNGPSSSTSASTTQGATTTGGTTSTSGGASTTGTVTATASVTTTTTSSVTATAAVTGSTATVTGTTTSATATESSSSGSTTGGGCSEAQVDCAGTCVDGLAAPIERSGSYVLEFAGLYFAVDADGGKVVEFKRAGGENVFTTSAVHETNFGSTLWTAPQADWDWPPVPEIDSEPYTVTADDAAGTITMVSMGTPSVGPNVTVTKVFTANPCDQTVDISYSIANSGAAAVSFSAWDVTRVVPGGLSFWGAEEGLLGASDLMSAEFVTDTYWFDHVVDTTSGLKLFSEGIGGYIAFTQGTDLFVKAFTDVPANGHPPDHGEVEVYEGENDGYVELEVVGSYGSIAAGSSATLEMRWYLRPMPDGATRAVGDAALKAAVLDLIAP